MSNEWDMGEVLEKLSKNEKNPIIVITDKRNDFPSVREKFTRLVNFYIYLHMRGKIDDDSFRKNVGYLDHFDERQINNAYHNTRNIHNIKKDEIDWSYVYDNDLWWYDGWELE